MRLTASKPRRISFTASYSSPQSKATFWVTPEKALTISGTTMDHEVVEGKVKFKGTTCIKPQGGSEAVSDTSVVVKNADAVTIYISIASNFNSYKDITGNENERAVVYEKAFSKNYDKILKGTISLPKALNSKENSFATYEEHINLNTVWLCVLKSKVRRI